MSKMTSLEDVLSENRDSEPTDRIKVRIHLDPRILAPDGVQPTADPTSEDCGWHHAITGNYAASSAPVPVTIDEVALVGSLGGFWFEEIFGCCACHVVQESWKE